MKNILIILLFFWGANSFSQTPEEKAKELQDSVAKGWNTWNNSSLVSFTQMPQGFTINLVLKEFKTSNIMRNPLMYKSEQHITLGAHTDNGEYTDLQVDWNDMKFRIQSGTDSGNLVVLVTPLTTGTAKIPLLITETSVLWQPSAKVYKKEGKITWTFVNDSTSLYSTCDTTTDTYSAQNGPFNIYAITSEVGISTGKAYSLDEIKTVLAKNSKNLEDKKKSYGNQSEIFNALQTAVAWNTIYEPTKKRVITPVSRSWSDWHFGYVLFCWDNYFVSYMLSLYNKELAYANAIAITSESDETGFVPNMSDAVMKTRDRSQPPVGSLCVREIYKKYHEKWFLELLYDKLLRWNRWWAEKRDINGLLAWGSNFYQPLAGNYWETKESGVGTWKGASLESGMDNSPMYVQIPFDATKEVLKLWDVGLNSMYIMDCNALADIALELGKTDDFDELIKRRTKYSNNLNKLWNESAGIYCNRRVDNGTFSLRLSPTCFYPLLTGVPDKKKIDRMMKEHYYNTQEFYGDWFLPSVPKDDADFDTQGYWTGRIWPPLNFLVYLGLRKHGLDTTQNELAQKSKNLLMKNWIANRYLCENYNPITGIGAEPGSQSDPFYHWGALLGFMDCIESGIVGAPEVNLNDDAVLKNDSTIVSDSLSNPTSIETHKTACNSPQILVYPNPSGNLVYIKITKSELSQIKLVFTNLNGHFLNLQVNKQQTDNNCLFTVNLKDLANDELYFCKIYLNDKFLTSKKIFKHSI